MHWLLLAQLATAQDAVSLEAVRRVQEGDAPSVTFIGGASGHLSANVSCSGHNFSLSKPLAPGIRHTLPFEGLPKGSHSCRGDLSLEGDDFSGQMPLSFDVQVLPRLVLTVNRSDLHLDGHMLAVVGSRGLRRVAVEAFGERGSKLGEGQTSAGGDTRVEIQWGGQPGEVLKLTVTGWDMDDLYGEVHLFPWHYEIPHDDLVFATGDATITSNEEPKLETAWTELQGVLDRFGDVVEVRLYVAGYTDTVGGHAANQALSERRARSIADWFKQRGFAGPIAFQGFGESALAIATPDETNEAGNRRATYILASEPPVGEPFPSAAWTTLR
jgi:hypothetical protein